MTFFDSTILGAIMFLRFGYAVGNVSFLGVFLIIVMGHLVTIPTAMAMQEEEKDLRQMIRSGRLPISEHNVEVIPQIKDLDRRDLIRERSKDADLIIVGFRAEAIKRRKQDVFTGYEGVGSVLFVNTKKEISLVEEEPERRETADDEAEPAEGVMKKEDGIREHWSAPHSG